MKTKARPIRHLQAWQQQEIGFEVDRVTGSGVFSPFFSPIWNCTFSKNGYITQRNHRNLLDKYTIVQGYVMVIGYKCLNFISGKSRSVCSLSLMWH